MTTTRMGPRHAGDVHWAFWVTLIASCCVVPRCTAVTTEYCSNPPHLEHGRATQRGQGILGYPVGSFAYYECDQRYSPKDGVELYRSCEFNGERAVWSDVSSECVSVHPSRLHHRFGAGDDASDVSSTLDNSKLVGRDDDERRAVAVNEDNRPATGKATSADELSTMPNTPVVFSDRDEGSDAEEEDSVPADNDNSNKADIEYSSPLMDKLKYHGNNYGKAFGQNPAPSPTKAFGLAIYPAVPLTEHQVTAYARLPDQGGPPVLIADVRAGRWNRCGMAPMIPNAIPNTDPQQMFSVGSRIVYKCGAGKVPNVPERLMQTMCVNDNGHVHWTPLDGQCVDDFDVEFPEDQRDVETMLTAASSRAATNGANQAHSNDVATERDRIIVSKTLFLQPPPFPNPPWRVGGEASKRESQRRASMCDSVFADDEQGSSSLNMEKCRKPPSLQEIATHAIFYGDNGQEGEGHPALGDHYSVVTTENDLSVLKRRRYGGARNPEEIARPPSVVPAGPPRRIDVNLIPNDDNDSHQLHSTAERDERNCLGDECLPGPGPDELESAALPEEVNYQVPSEMTKGGKLALNFFHDKDRRTFSGSTESVVHGVGDTGFPFNDMYRQKKGSKSKNVLSDRAPRPPIESRAYAMSERLMRGGLHGPRSSESGAMEPQFVTGAILALVGVLGLALLACKCSKGCSSMLSGGFCGDKDDDQQCADEEGGAMSDGDGDDDEAGDDGLVFQQGGHRNKPFRLAKSGWRPSNRTVMNRLEHSDGY